VPRARIALAIFLVTGAAAAQTKTTMMVPMRDGTALATDVWRAEGDTSAHPVLLRRTPYGRAVDAGAAKGVTGLGYVLVSQDVRGRGESKGTFLPFFDDYKDGPDTMDWIAKQPFSDGKVGSYSGSAEGIVQLMALGQGPAPLKCAHVTVASDDLYTGLIYPGGAWRTELTTNWLNGLMQPEVIPIFRQHEARDAFWDPVRLDAKRRGNIKAAVFFVGAQFDIFPETAKTFRAFRAEADPSARDNMFMILGPWTHGGPGVVKQGEITFPADAKYEKQVEDLITYFNWCLKGGPRPTWPRVRSYVTHFKDDGLNGDGEWRGGETWPPALPHRVLHLHDDSTLDATDRPFDPRTVPVDPSKPVPSVGGGNLTTLAGPADQRAIDARREVFVATTEPVERDSEIIGEPVATIEASSTAEDFDVIVRLSVVTTDGHVILVHDGIRRARFAAGYEAVKWVAAGTKAKMEIALGPVSIKLSKGQKLRVAVQGTSAPRYEANAGVAQPLSATSAPRASTLTIHGGSIDLQTEGFAPPSVTPDGGAPATPAPTTESAGCGCTTPRTTATPWVLALLLTLATRRAAARRRPR
jgi:uncharacterized protein